MPTRIQFPPKLVSETFTIANGASLSAGVSLVGITPTQLVMPTGWTTANLTFQGSANGADYYDLYDRNGYEYNVVAAASRAIILPPMDFAGIRWLKIRSGTSASAVNQAAERILTVLGRPL